MTTLYITHPDCRRHEMGSWHPESPERLDAVADRMLASGVLPCLQEADAPLATRQAILRVHDAAYLDDLQARTPVDGHVALDQDTLINPYSLQAALRAAGAAVSAVDAVMAGRADSAFCAVRPPGHHAEPGKAMGFCLFNNVAIAACHALEAHGLERVAVIDFDVHHGNGTESALADDPRVLMCGFFQHPLYPFSGSDSIAANMVNVPLPAGAGGPEVRDVVETYWLPRLALFKPQLILISAGFDAHREDDMGQMGLTETDYIWITERIMEVAQAYAGGRVVSCLEGGYDLSSLGRSVTAHVKAMAGL